MPISFTCWTCGSKIKAPDKAAGMALKCPKCGELHKVPRPAEESKVAEPPKSADPPKAATQSAPSPPAAKGKKSGRLLFLFLAVGGVLAILLALNLFFFFGQTGWFAPKAGSSGDPKLGQARMAFEDALDKWKTSKDERSVRPAPLLFTRLLDYKVMSFAAKPGAPDGEFAASAAVQVETQGPDNGIGGGPVVSYQVDYRVVFHPTYDLGGGPYSFFPTDVKRYAPLP